MRKSTFAATLAVILVLTGCSASHYDCSSSETKELIRELLAEGQDELVLNTMLKNVRIEGIVTDEIDKDVGWYSCRAQIISKLPNGKIEKTDLDYEVSRVDSDDADLEVAIDDETAIQFARAIRYSLNNEH